MDIEAVNKLLKRQIKSGTEYDMYFENVPCKPTFLGTDNTDFTLQKMKEWTFKHLHQVKSISHALKGNTVEQSINNIHAFLYNHIQYEIDGSEQMLKSPACSWKTRQSGIDCKSFSMFASAILCQLQIPHSFRKIKQPNLAPQSWTHVYVVIPKSNLKNLSNNHWVIDATIYPNKEVPYLSKKDLQMSVKLKHYGLNAPETSGGTVSDEYNEQLKRAISKFNAFLDILERKGVSQSVTNRAMSNLNRYMSKGVEPTMLQIFGSDKALISSVLSQGLNGWVDTVATAVTSEEGGEAGEVDYGELISEFADSDWFASTFGSVFNNGLNFSCWGSSNTPQQSQAESDTDAKWIISSSGLLNSMSLASVQKFLDWCSIYMHARDIGRNNNDIASCTRDGNQVGYDRIRVLRDETLKALQVSFRNQGKILTTQPYTKAWLQINPPSGYLDGMINYNNFPSLNAMVTNAPINDEETPLEGGGWNPNGTGNNGNTTTLPNNGNNIQQAGFGAGSAILLLGLATGTYLYTRNKKK